MIFLRVKDGIVNLASMKSDKMVKFSYRCKCGAMVHGWAAHKVTPAEIESLQKRDCDNCDINYDKKNPEVQK